MDVQNGYIHQNAKDIMAGKDKSKKDMERHMPLYRRKYPDGSAELVNVPDDFLVWTIFMGTLNDDD